MKEFRVRRARAPLVRGLWGLSAWAGWLSEGGRLKKPEKQLMWMINKAWLVGLPQGELQLGGVSAAGYRQLHLHSLVPHIVFNPNEQE